MNINYTRKFLIRSLPDILIEKTIKNERYYLYAEDNIVVRVQSIDSNFELECKKNMDRGMRQSSKIQLTEKEFNKLKMQSRNKIERLTITLNKYPDLKLRVYEGEYSGLIRAEINFINENDSNNFMPYDWLDKEITNSPLANDATLLALSPEEFVNLIK